MITKFTRICVQTFISLTVVATAAFAGDLEWSGAYRIEGNDFQNLLLKTGSKKSKSYGNHQLILRPKIVAGDGLYINAQLNLARTQDAAGNNIGGNQFGAVFGNGFEAGTNVPTSGNSGTLSESQEEENIVLSQFYLTHVQEFGSLIVGRAPVQFGLGMTHSAGRGAFDHYMDTRDILGYKVVMGNFFFLPMLGKVKEDALAGYDDVNEWLIHLQYENPETETAMGLMYWDRKAHQAGNDSATTVAGPFGTNPTGDYSYKMTSIYYGREFENSRVGFEVGNQSGGTNVDNRNVKFSGMGIAAEFDYKPSDKKWSWGAKAGWATGDDNSTADEYEGFVFDRNYDVALMMFNHGLGQANFLHTKVNGTNGAATVNAEPDTEAISNVMYLSPYWNYKWSDKWSLNTSVTTGWLNETKLTAGNNDGDNSLGYELDVSFNFSPNERVVWQNTFGWMMPGTAFEGDNTQNFSTSAAYGFVSRAAISF
jgi:hypothetical protein